MPGLFGFVRQGHLLTKTGRLGYNHNDACRTRVMQLMTEDLDYRQLIQKHQQGRDQGELSSVEVQTTNIDVMSTEYVEERRGQIKKAIQHIEQHVKQEGRTNVETQLNQTMARMLVANIDVAEVYSPPKVAQMAREMGLKGGWSLDITTTDTDGQAWDFNRAEMRNRAARLILRDKPLLLIGSPMCTVYSSMNQINHARMSPEVVRLRFQYARRHLEFCIKLYQMQIEAGRYFVHEHPHTASSWEESCVQSILKQQNVTRVVGDQCMYGLKARDQEREGPARKSIGCMTNSVCIAQQLSQRCPNKAGYQVHRHVRLEDGRTKQAQVYPKELCKAICLGIQKQIRADTAGQFLLLESGNQNVSSKELMNVSRELETKYQTVEEPQSTSLEQAWDDVSGAELDPEKVKKARAEEIEYTHKMQLYEEVPVRDCYNKTGRGPITVCWIDINKVDNQSPNYRSRLVAREINIYKRDDSLRPLLHWRPSN